VRPQLRPPTDAHARDLKPEPASREAAYDRMAQEDELRDKRTDQQRSDSLHDAPGSLATSPTGA
jgi:hypothetical protein